MKHKGLFIITLLLFLASLSAGTYGYYYSKTYKKSETIIEEKTKIVYIYYLEDQKVDTMPKNETNLDNTYESMIEYKFLRFSCTNDLSGEFDENTWQFIPSGEKDSTCSLYFTYSKYSVTFTVVNGTQSETNPKYINREENGVFTITPLEGYEFKDAICSDEKETTWDSTKNTLTINAITKDVMCKVNFSIKNLTAKITVSNGTGSTSETVEYGSSLDFIVEANTGYENPKVECTNKQEAIFENNKVTIESLTNNTECKVTFVAVPVTKYKLSVELPSQVTVIAGTTLQEVEAQKDGTFTLKVDEEYITSINCGDVTPSKEEEIDSYTKKYTFLSMTKDISCKVTATRSE